MIGYEQIVKRIELEGGIPREEIEERIGKKLEQLGDLISREGAAHILAHELGVKVYDGLKKRLKIGELVAGITSVDILGKIIAVYGVRAYERNGKPGSVGSFLLGDETGSCRVAVWDGGLLEQFPRVQADEVVELQNAAVKERGGWKELHLGRGGGIRFDVAEQIIVRRGGQRVRERKKLGDVVAGEFVNVAGYVVAVFEPRFYEGCGECGRKIVDGGCAEHKGVGSRRLPVVNFYLDDGSGNIRVVAFREVAETLLPGLLAEQGFEQLRGEVMGRYVCVEGRIVENAVFGRKEMIAASIAEVDVAEVVREILK